MGTPSYQFTGNPRIAEYKPRGLDYFMQKPMLEAEVRGAAMKLNNMSNNSTAGLYKTDLPGAKAMMESVDKERESLTDTFLDGGDITEGMVNRTVRNYQSNAQVKEQLKTGFLNAQKIQKQVDQIAAAAMTPGGAKMLPYLTKMHEQSLEEFGSTWTPEDVYDGEGVLIKEAGTMNHFTKASVPGYIDLPAEIQKELTIAMGQLVIGPNGIGRFDPNSIKVSQVDVEGGTQRILTYNNPRDTKDNNAAMDKAFQAIQARIKDPNTAWGAYAQFMGDEFVKSSVIDALTESESMYREDYMAGTTHVANAGFTKDVVGAAGLSGMQAYKANRAQFPSTLKPVTAAIPETPTKGTTATASDGTENAMVLASPHGEGTVTMSDEEQEAKYVEDRAATSQKYNAIYATTNTKVFGVPNPSLEVQRNALNGTVLQGDKSVDPNFVAYLAGSPGAQAGVWKGRLNTNMSALEANTGSTDTRITQEEMDAVEAEQDNSLTNSYDLKVSIAQDWSNLYNDYQESTRSHLEGWSIPVDFTKKDGRVSDQTQTVLNQIGKNITTARIVELGISGNDFVKVSDSQATNDGDDDDGAAKAQTLDQVTYNLDRGNFIEPPKIIPNSVVENMGVNVGDNPEGSWVLLTYMGGTDEAPVIAHTLVGGVQGFASPMDTPINVQFENPTGTTSEPVGATTTYRGLLNTAPVGRTTLVYDDAGKPAIEVTKRHESGGWHVNNLGDGVAGLYFDSEVDAINAMIEFNLRNTKNALENQ